MTLDELVNKALNTCSYLSSLMDFCLCCKEHSVFDEHRLYFTSFIKVVVRSSQNLSFSTCFQSEGYTVNVDEPCGFGTCMDMNVKLVCSSLSNY